MGGYLEIPYRSTVQVTHGFISTTAQLPSYQYSCLSALCRDPSLEHPWSLDLDFESDVPFSEASTKTAGPFSARSQLLFYHHYNKHVSDLTAESRAGGTFFFSAPYTFIDADSGDVASRLVWLDEATLLIDWEFSDILVYKTYQQFKTIIEFIPAAPLPTSEVQGLDQRVTPREDVVLMRHDLDEVVSNQPCCPVDSDVLGSVYRESFG